MGYYLTEQATETAAEARTAAPRSRMSRPGRIGAKTRKGVPTGRAILSSKYTDQETGLVMYPYRPYSPALGRFLSRDPILDEAFFRQHFDVERMKPSLRMFWREQSLLPAYLFVENDPITLVDPMGLDVSDAIITACKCLITGAAIKKCQDMKKTCVACLEKWSDLGGLAGWQGKSWKKQEPEKAKCSGDCDAALECYDKLQKACEAAKDLP